MHNLDREKKIILISALPFMVSALFLIAIGQGMFASGASKEEDKNQTETIYERRECRDGKCYDAGKKLIQFKGTDAECEKYKSEDERMKCYSEHSQSAYACSFLEDKEEVQDCYEKRRGNIFMDNQGGEGTLVANKSVTSNGARLYLTGFDCHGTHKIVTGTDESANSAVTLYDSSRDVRYGGNLSIGADISLMSEEAGVYFGSDVEYGEKNLGNGVVGQSIISYDNFNGMNLNRCLDLKVLANHRHILTIVGKNRTTFGATEVEKGLEVNGDLKADFMYFQGRFLQWTEPIRGHFVLYYKTQPQEPTKCELGDYPRDAQPDSTPAVDAPLVSSGGASGSSGNTGTGTAGPVAPIVTGSGTITKTWSGAYVSVNKILQRKFVFPGTGPGYGKTLKFVFSDGQVINVGDSSHMTIVSSLGRKYQPGGGGEVATMEVYADRGSSPDSVTLYYNN